MTGVKRIPFNINDQIRVKLTDHGRKIHREQFEELRAFCKKTSEWKYVPPAEDENGWSSWQLWCLIDLFGAHVGMGCQSPFETNIEFCVSEGE